MSTGYRFSAVADAAADTAGSNGVAPDTPAERIRSSLLNSKQVKGLEPPVALVDGLLFSDSLAMLFGASGVGKSFLAIDVVLHVASGSWWQRKEVQQGPVLYVVAEGAAGFGKRLDAWERRHQLTTDALPVSWLPWAVNLADTGWTAALAEVTAEIKPVLVVIDTFARCAIGAEENSARDVGRVIAHLDIVRRAATSCVWLIHHSGKNPDAGARGSSALRGAMDTELEVVGDSRNFLLHVRKQKDAPEANPLQLRLRSVTGSTSVAIERAPRGAEAELPAAATATLDALVAVDVPGGVSANVWRLSAGLPERTFYRHRKGLLDQGHVINIGTDGQPRYRPSSEATQISPSEGDEP